MSDTDAEKQLLFDEIHLQFRNAVSYNLYTGLAYGMLVVVYFISIRIQLSKGGLFHSPGHIFMSGSTTLIFVLATVVIVVGPGLTLQAIPGVIRFIDPSLAIGCDMVCAWRAIVLWKYDRRVVFILSACITGTFAVSIYDLKLALKNHPGPNGGDGVDEGKVAAIIVGPMLGTNILSTLLIAWKAWEYRNTVSAHLRKGSASDRAEKVLALLIESGFVYCLLWIFYLLTAFSVLPGSGSYTVNLVMLFISVSQLRLLSDHLG
ncbi:hypothetical protein EDB85DRAFT_2236275 [Lactarius pseudohatsudake]|nr:hypothetical protein EDB85DRAFT_2236275 [Lactarius pseudohatsudake]